AGARGRFGQTNEVKERLHRFDLQRLSPLNGRLPHFSLYVDGQGAYAFLNGKSCLILSISL
ncbi:hypothetical protein, partial [Siminovitchia fortis]|uniref:hypothetical protein n=1 Tax=Siminovitchia fortis TaxID=254758 RepID=UPI001C92E143